MTKTNKKFIKLIEEEIQWGLEHPAINLSGTFQQGFLSGLKQAINIIETGKAGDSIGYMGTTSTDMEDHDF